MSHDHMSMSMDHSMPTETMAMTGMPSSTAAAAGGHGMGMGMGGPNACVISMMWNWNVMNSCFISRSWRITSNGMFAGSCIGVILLVIALEFLRRSGKEYDRYILAQYTRSLSSSTTSPTSSSSSTADPANKSGNTTTTTAAPACAPVSTTQLKFRPNVFQQAIRALLHMLQFAVAYFIMLLAMYYNGYIIICIFIGAYLGYFIFGWESFNVGNGGRDRMQENVTVCCG